MQTRITNDCPPAVLDDTTRPTDLLAGTKHRDTQLGRIELLGLGCVNDRRLAVRLVKRPSAHLLVLFVNLRAVRRRFQAQEEHAW